MKIYLCVGTLQNIYFNVKDSGYFDKCNISLLNMRKSLRQIFFFLFSLQTHQSISWGFGAHLGTQKLLHFFNFKIYIPAILSTFYWDFKIIVHKIFNSKTFLHNNVCKNTLLQSFQVR